MFTHGNKRKTYRPMTKFSGEQVTIVQLHGSTESPSQFSSTPWGSSRERFMPIKACTEIIKKSQITQMRKMLLLNLYQLKTVSFFFSFFRRSYLQSLHLWEREFHMKNSKTREKLRKTEQRLPLLSFLPLNPNSQKHRREWETVTDDGILAYDDW